MLPKPVHSRASDSRPSRRVIWKVSASERLDAARVPDRGLARGRERALPRLAWRQRDLQTLRTAHDVECQRRADWPPAQVPMKCIDPVQRRLVHANDQVTGT